MAAEMYPRDPRPALPTGRALIALLCSFAWCSTSSCAFDPAGTSDGRDGGTGRSRGSERANGELSPEDAAEAARAAADRLRTSAGQAGTEGAGERPSEGAAGHTSADDHDRADEAKSAAAAAGAAAAPMSASGTAAVSGGAAGVLGVMPPATNPPAADGGKLDESDGGDDDSDAGSEPPVDAATPPSAAGAGGTSGTAGVAGSSAGGRGAEAGRSGSGGRSGESGGADRELLLSLLDVSVGVLQAHPNAQPGDLLQRLTGATSVDPALLASVLDFVARTEDCEGDRSDACERVCDLVEDRCDACREAEDCRAALRSACGTAASECR